MSQNLLNIHAGRGKSGNAVEQQNLFIVALSVQLGISFICSLSWGSTRKDKKRTDAADSFNVITRPTLISSSQPLRSKARKKADPGLKCGAIERGGCPLLSISHIETKRNSSY